MSPSPNGFRWVWLSCLGCLLASSAWGQSPGSPTDGVQEPRSGGGTFALPAPPSFAAESPSDARPPQSRIQGGFPSELVLPPPSDQSLRNADRFVEGMVDPELPLNLVVGRPKILQLARTPKRIYIPSEEVVTAEIIDQQSGREIAVTGAQQGTATLFLWFDDPAGKGGQTIVSYFVRVFEDPDSVRPIEELERELNEKFPDSYVELDQIEDRLIVRGQVPDVSEMAQLLQILAGARGVRTSVMRDENPVSVTALNNFSDQPDVLEQEEQAAQRRRVIDPLALARAGIINQLKVVGEQQVLLKVTVAEVNRTAARSIGLNFAIDNSSGLTVFETLAGGVADSASALASLDMGQVRVAIDALRTLNLSRTLAETNLVAMNGQGASFQSGGQFPVPVISSGVTAGGGNLQGVNFIPFGVQLNFTPAIQDRDTVSLQINANISTLDASTGTSIGGGAGGTQVTGIDSNNFSTAVRLRSGQTIAVAGLMQTNYAASTSRLPFWGDLPLLGATGGANGNSSGEIELVILVTPHLVAPISETASLPLPGDDVHEPTDIEFYVANRLESRRQRDFRTSVRTDLARLRQGESCCPDQFMIGDVGPTDRCVPRAIPTPHAATPRGSASPVLLPELPGDSADAR